MGRARVDPSDMVIQATEDRTQTNGARLRKTRFGLTANANVFCSGVVGTWNTLSSEVVSSEVIRTLETLSNKMRYELLRPLGNRNAGNCKAD